MGFDDGFMVVLWDIPSGNLTYLWKITMSNGYINYFYGLFAQQTVKLPEATLSGWWYTYPSEKYESQFG